MPEKNHCMLLGDEFVILTKNELTSDPVPGPTPMRREVQAWPPVLGWGCWVALAGLFKLRKQTWWNQNGLWWLWVCQMATWQVGVGVSPRGKGGSHSQASCNWAESWWRRWGGLWTGRDEALPLSENGLNSSAEIFWGYLLGPLASGRPRNSYASPSLVFLLNSVVPKHSVKLQDFHFF